MAIDNPDYEAETVNNLHSKIAEIRKLAAEIEKAPANATLPINVEEFLKKLSVATKECEYVISQHLGSYNFSEPTLRAVAFALSEIHHGMNSLILSGVMSKPNVPL